MIHDKGMREQHYFSVRLVSVHVSVALSPPKLKLATWSTSSHDKVVREKHYFSARLAVRPPGRHAIFSQTTGRNLTKVATGLPFLGKGVRELVRLSVR